MTDTPARAAVRSIVDARKNPSAPRQPEVILHTRLKGGFVTVTFDGPDFGSAQCAGLRRVLDIMEESAIEFENREPLLAAAGKHEPEPVALSRRLGSEEE